MVFKKSRNLKSSVLDANVTMNNLRRDKEISLQTRQTKRREENCDLHIMTGKLLFLITKITTLQELQLFKKLDASVNKCDAYLKGRASLILTSFLINTSEIKVGFSEPHHLN